MIFDNSNVEVVSNGNKVREDSKEFYLMLAVPAYKRKMFGDKKVKVVIEAGNVVILTPVESGNE